VAAEIRRRTRALATSTAWIVRWAAAWTPSGSVYDKRAKSEAAAKDTSAARDDYFMAFRYYTAARWPVPNSIGQDRKPIRTLNCIRNYGRFSILPFEIVHIPFEARNSRLKSGSKDVRPAPVVFMINGTDSRKEDEVQGVTRCSAAASCG